MIQLLFHKINKGTIVQVKIKISRNKNGFKGKFATNHKK